MLRAVTIWTIASLCGDKSYLADNLEHIQDTLQNSVTPIEIFMMVDRLYEIRLLHISPCKLIFFTLFNMYVRLLEQK